MQCRLCGSHSQLYGCIGWAQERVEFYHLGDLPVHAVQDLLEAMVRLNTVQAVPRGNEPGSLKAVCVVQQQGRSWMSFSQAERNEGISVSGDDRTSLFSWAAD